MIHKIITLALMYPTAGFSQIYYQLGTGSYYRPKIIEYDGLMVTQPSINFIAQLSMGYQRHGHWFVESNPQFYVIDYHKIIYEDNGTKYSELFGHSMAITNAIFVGMPICNSEKQTIQLALGYNMILFQNGLKVYDHGRYNGRYNWYAYDTSGFKNYNAAQNKAICFRVHFVKKMRHAKPFISFTAMYKFRLVDECKWNRPSGVPCKSRGWSELTFTEDNAWQYNLVAGLRFDINSKNKHLTK